MTCKSVTPQRGSQYRSSSYLAATLAGAMLYGCAQLQRAPEPEQPTPAPSVQPTPTPDTPKIGEPKSAQPPAQQRAPIVQPKTPPASDDSATGIRQRGRISLYGREFSGKKTASGEPFDPQELTMAHRTLPFGTRVRVTNLENQRSVEVVVNDRGPFVAGRIADLSEAAARRIDMVTDGVVEGVLEILELASSR